MDLFERVSEDIKNAMKAKDKVALETLRNVKKFFLEAKTAPGANDILTDDAALKIIQKLVKQGKDSAEIYIGQGRQDLADGELAQVKVMEAYLPKQMTPEELEACWQQERKRSQEYQQLKAECESRRNASRDAKEICQSYLNDHPKAAEPLPEMEFISQEELERRLQQNREAEKAIQQETGRIEPDSHAGRGNSEIAGAGRAGCSVDCTD